MTNLTLTIEGARLVVVTRLFAADPKDVFRAHLEPELIQKWLLGPDGWGMTVCISDPKPGGAFKFAWSNGDGGDLCITGEYLEITPVERIVHVERMHKRDPTPDNHVQTTFAPHGDGTLLTLRMTLPDAATRDAMLQTGMEHGMEASYGRIDPLFAK